MQQAKILVVDDEPDVVLVLKTVLSKNGYQVTTALSGLEGLTKAFADPPDLILLDIMMPEMDGWEVLRLLKRDRTTVGIPIVIVSARTATEDRIRGLEQGAVDYITKPFSLRQIVAKINTLVASRQAQAN